MIYQPLEQKEYAQSGIREGSPSAERESGRQSAEGRLGGRGVKQEVALPCAHVTASRGSRSAVKKGGTTELLRPLGDVRAFLFSSNQIQNRGKET